MPHAIVIDDDPGFQEAIAEVLSQEGFTVESATTLARARQILGERMPDLALLDLSLPDGQGSQLLSELAGMPFTDVVLVTGNATVDSAVDAFREGVVDYLTKPVELLRLRAVLANIARRRDLSGQVEDLRAELRRLGRFGPLIGSAPPMQHLYDMIARVAPTNATVFIQGESGTGKELVAQTIHQLSRRRKQPFVALNCGAVTPQLIESELFGHERGSFTGADRIHKGYFERAHGGTLFLDEITEMPIELQVKLLRVLEMGKVVRIGGERELPVDVRLLAATNRDPHEAVAQQKLRQDLLFRLSVFPLLLPPLRERGADIDLLAEYFLSHLNRTEKAAKCLDRTAVERMRAYQWPGNVRELKNVLDRAFILADQVITTECLPTLSGEVTRTSPEPTGLGPAIAVKPGISIGEAEKRLIFATLEAYNGNKERAARVLEISLKTLYNRLNAYNGRGKQRPASADGPLSPLPPAS